MQQSIPQKTYTIDDLLDLPGDERAELINGKLVMMAPASARHSDAAGALTAVLKINCDKKMNTGDSDTWRIIPEAWTSYDKGNIFVHDIAGFSRRELKSLPAKGPIQTKPIWVCEVLSPSNWINDTEHKRVVLERYRVPYYWLVDPDKTSIFVFEMNEQAEHYQITRTVGKEDGIIRIPPFLDLDLDLNAIFED